jgi:hypothetical protein
VTRPKTTHLIGFSSTIAEEGRSAGSETKPPPLPAGSKPEPTTLRLVVHPSGRSRSASARAGAAPTSKGLAQQKQAGHPCGCTISGHQPRGRRSHIVEKRSRIGPLLETRKARNEQGNCTSNLWDPEDIEKIERITQTNKGHTNEIDAQKIPNPTGKHFKRHNDCENPVRNRACPLQTCSRCPIAFCPSRQNSGHYRADYQYCNQRREICVLLVTLISSRSSIS